MPLLAGGTHYQRLDFLEFVTCLSFDLFRHGFHIVDIEEPNPRQRRNTRAIRIFKCDGRPSIRYEPSFDGFDICCGKILPTLGRWKFLAWRQWHNGDTKFNHRTGALQESL